MPPSATGGLRTTASGRPPATGHRVAQRNLWVSIPALMLGFVVWQVWSVTVVKLNDVGFGFTQSQLFWLTAIPGITGGTFRILYTFIGPIFGERKFTAFSTIVLVVPILWLGFALQDNGTPYWELALIAAVCGIGGANFASSKVPEAQAAALKQPEMEAGAVTGFSSAIAAYGFFFIPAMFAAMAVTSALWLFIGFYATCLAVCWWFYARKGAEAPS
ncbi:MFS transporter [Streptomyces erythrochromogenes]|uniref:hypothetical protein n=1 Tax=Streptomyces erythrochromogenes TaxID=285574 RepID=UPI0037F84FC0